MTYECLWISIKSHILKSWWHSVVQNTQHPTQFPSGYCSVLPLPKPRPSDQPVSEPPNTVPFQLPLLLLLDHYPCLLRHCFFLSFYLCLVPFQIVPFGQWEQKEDRKITSLKLLRMNACTYFFGHFPKPPRNSRICLSYYI